MEKSQSNKMKTILITGSTDGIGKVTALKLAKEGHVILLHGRNQNKLDHVKTEIQELTGNDTVNGIVADLSDFNQIKKMIDLLRDKVSTIDVLINNAGVFKSNILHNKNGLDMRLAVNYFAPYILTNGVLPLLEASPNARVVNLSSAAQAPVSFDVLQGNQVVSEQNAYAQSKLALTMWSFYFAQQHKNINTIAVNPGSLLNTKMVQEAYGQHWDSVDKGATILFNIALSDDYETKSGQYFDNDLGSFNRAHQEAYNAEKIQQLISETERIIKTL